MPTKKETIAELNFLTELLSTRVRTISAGTLAFCWVLIFESIFKKGSTTIIDINLLLVPVSLAILTLVADFAQYWFGYLDAHTAFNEMEEKDKEFINYDYTTLAYRMRTLLFHIKQAFMLGSVLSLLIVVGMRIFKA
jgi:hypothetical protein